MGGQTPTAGLGDPVLVNPPLSQICAVMFAGGVALLINGLQPLVLGHLVRAGRLSVQQTGLAVTIELLAIGFSVAICTAALRPRRLRWIGFAAAAAHAGVALLELHASGLGVILLRGCAGLAAGVMLWSTIGMFTRMTHPEQWTAVFLTFSTLQKLAVMSLMSFGVAPKFGITGILVGLAAISGLAALAALIGPRSYPPLEAAHTERAKTSLGFGNLLSLAAVFGYMAGVTAVWVYLGQIFTQSGFAIGSIGVALSVALGFQVLGGLAAATLGARLPVLPALTIATLLTLGALAVFGGLAGSNPYALMAASAAFGFAWLFAPPYQVLFLIEHDPSRRTALQFPSAQLFGSAAGPFVASIFVRDADLGPVLWIGLAGLIVSLALACGLHLRTRTVLA